MAREGFVDKHVGMKARSCHPESVRCGHVAVEPCNAANAQAAAGISRACTENTGKKGPAGQVFQAINSEGGGFRKQPQRNIPEHNRQICYGP